MASPSFLGTVKSDTDITWRKQIVGLNDGAWRDEPPGEVRAVREHLDFFWDGTDGVMAQPIGRGQATRRGRLGRGWRTSGASRFAENMDLYWVGSD